MYDVVQVKYVCVYVYESMCGTRVLKMAQVDNSDYLPLRSIPVEGWIYRTIHPEVRTELKLVET